MSQDFEIKSYKDKKESGFIKNTARQIALGLQKYPYFFPNKFCLITGAPRSGTSALCKWLNHHPDVSAFFESRILVSTHYFMEELSRFKSLKNESRELEKLICELVKKYYSSSRVLINRNLVLDKEPLEPVAFPAKDYDQFIINVRKIFPKCKIIFVLRNPISTIWSMTQRSWGESTNDSTQMKFSLDEYIENWCSCADLVFKYHADSYFHIVQFERLIRDPENESTRIYDFLRLKLGENFMPRQTKEQQFSKGELQKISGAVGKRLDQLRTIGITDL